MLWTLIVLTAGGSPIPTGLTFDTLDACYAAEGRMAGEYARYYNNQMKAGTTEEAAEFLRSRMLRGVCVPHAKAPP